jgi:putative membrane protein
VLEADGIIGWVVAETWSQRRVGLVDLVATTAAGAERVVVRDVPRETAIRLADRTTPGVLTAWTA